jgi:glycosyltransferase involved in cell wall biosynthesis
MKIVFCTDGIFPYSVGGMQRHSRLLIEELQKYDEIELVIIHPHKLKIFDSERINEISLCGIDESKNYILECYRYSKRVYAALLDYPNAVIYSQGLSVWYKSHLISGRLIVNPHGLEPFQVIGLKHRLLAIPFRVIISTILKNASFRISLGGKLTTIINDVLNSDDGIIEIPNAVSLPSPSSNFRQLSTNKVNVLFLGRFASNKGINILFDVIDKIHTEGYGGQFNFTLAGKGPLFLHFLKRKKWNNVKMLGFVEEEDMPELFRSHHVFVLPTLFEGMPTVVLEAMSYGLAVIVSDVGATKIMVDDSNGKTIVPGSIDDLYEKLIWYLKLDEANRVSLGLNSMGKVQNQFTWAIVAKQYCELFSRLDKKIKHEK